MHSTKNITLQLLAKQLNLHVSTVSRILRDGDGAAAKAASQSTIERVRSLAEEWNYVPNPHAISLKTKKSNLIGVSVPSLSDYVWASIYEGIDACALQKGYLAYVTTSYDEPKLQRKHVALARSRCVDGLIVGDAHATSASEAALHKLPMPFVLVLRHVGDFPSVTCDDMHGGRQAAEHLFHRGHRDVAVIAGSSITSTGLERTAGFTNFYREAGYPIPPERICHSKFDTIAGRECASRLIADYPSVTAIYAVNDFAAIGAMGAIRVAGLIPGVSMALVGYNDTPLAAELPIPLTTLRNPLHKIGENAMELLIATMQEQVCQSIVLRPELVVRESSSFSARSLI